jgi:hypothetical protein
MGKAGLAALQLFPSRSIVLGTAAIGMMCAASPAFSDPVQITGGNVYTVASWTGYDPPFGFELTGAQTSLGGITYTLPAGSVVNAGDTINLSETISVSADPFRTGPGQQTVDGVTYSNVFLAGTLHFAATPGTLPSGETDGFDTPFTMDGSISLFRPDPSSPYSAGEPVLIVPIEGRGTASLSFFPRGGMLAASSVTYRFADTPVSATPEPATLTLLGGGLIVTLARGRARRSWQRRSATPPSPR